MKTIAVIARKGGSGKTTVALHLAVAAHLRGRRTLIADTDPQGSSAAVLQGRKGEGPTVVQTGARDLVGLQAAAARGAVDFLVIDTPAGVEEDLGCAIVLADLSLLVIRPTFIDFAAALRTSEVLRKLRRPGVMVLNQAPAPRAGLEPPLVRKAQEALKLMRLPLAPAIIRARAAYQSATETGRSAEEIAAGTAAAAEIAALWSYVDRLMSGQAGERLRA